MVSRAEVAGDDRFPFETGEKVIVSIEPDEQEVRLKKIKERNP
jgi:hypothetical protein